MIGQQYQQKQSDGKSHTKCQRFDSAVTLPFVLHQIYQGRTHTENDEKKRDGDKNFHTELL